MAIIEETSGSTTACDGCGRTTGGSGQALGTEAFTVHDPNAGEAVQHHYCPHCASNRGLSGPVARIKGWIASVVPPAPAEESPSQ